MGSQTRRGSTFPNKQQHFLAAGQAACRVNFDRMKDAVSALSEKIPRLQDDGDREGRGRFVQEMAAMGSTLEADLERPRRGGDRGRRRRFRTGALSQRRTCL